MNQQSLPESAMFRPPINRAMRALDRSFFEKSIPLSAARIRDNKHISKCRTELGPDLLKLDRMSAVRRVRDSEGQEAKALLLRPEVRPDGKHSVLKFSRKATEKGGLELRCCQMLLRGAQSSPSWSRPRKSASYHMISN